MNFFLGSKSPNHWILYGSCWYYCRNSGLGLLVTLGLHPGEAESDESRRESVGACARPDGRGRQAACALSTSVGRDPRGVTVARSQASSGLATVSSAEQARIRQYTPHARKRPVEPDPPGSPATAAGAPSRPWSAGAMWPAALLQTPAGCACGGRRPPRQPAGCRREREPTAAAGGGTIARVRARPSPPPRTCVRGGVCPAAQRERVPGVLRPRGPAPDARACAAPSRSVVCRAVAAYFEAL